MIKKQIMTMIRRHQDVILLLVVTALLIAIVILLSKRIINHLDQDPQGFSFPDEPNPLCIKSDTLSVHHFNSMQ
jgi:hypothetical protein